ncbi:MAG: PD40 domain-containing protein [Gemmatimonadales bacterium]|nr:PD40 domain-containing protein [Gemmatimonadales bacterium]
MTRSLLPWVVLGSLIAGCNANGPAPSDAAELRIVADPARTDTVDAEPTEPLLIEVRTEDGKPVPNAAVELTVLPSEGGGVVWLRHFGTGIVDLAASDITDALGRTGAFVRMGNRPGTARVEVRVGGLADTLAFTVLPGRAATVALSAGDLVRYPGSRVTLQAVQRDRHDNPSTSAVTFSVDNPSVVSVAAANELLAGPAYGTSNVTVRAAEATASIRLAVAPSGTLAARDEHSGAIVLFDLDGSNRRTLVAETAGHHGFVSYAWMPGVDELVVSRSGELWQELVRYGLNGAVTRISPPQGELPFHALAPSVPTDRSWIYFFANWRNSIDVWRLRPNGTQLQSVPIPDLRDRAVAPAISPDGTRLAYVDASTWGPGELRVFTIGAGASSSWRLPGGVPSWSPAGDRIAYVDYARLIHTVAADGTGDRVVSSPLRTYVGGQLAWSPDGAWIAATSTETTRIELIQVATGITVPLFHTGGLSAPAWKR